MKLPVRQLSTRARSGSATLPGLLVASTILLIVVGAVVSTHAFGMRMMRVIQANQGADEPTHRELRRMEVELRSARHVVLGSGDERSFEELPANVVQAANALQVRPADDTNQFVRYFHDSRDGCFKRFECGDARPKTIADGIADANVFTVEDHGGTVLTNVPGNRVIGVRLRFSRIAATGAEVGKGKYFDAYEVKTKIAVNAW